MMDMISTLFQKMTEYYAGDPKRMQHFVKVHSFARQIGIMEGIAPETLFVLEATALVHDIGIKPAEKKYGSCTGKLQEQEGPAEAEALLSALGFSEQQRARICYLVGHHHTYAGIDGLDYQILVEADFLVNFYEDQCSQEGILAAYKNIFQTESGKLLCRTIYAIITLEHDRNCG